MTFFEAALQVLRDADGGPLHYREIAERALASGYIETSGLTPEATLNAVLHTHIKKAEASGQEPKLRQTGRGQFALSKKVKIGPLKHIEESNAKVRSQLVEHLRELDPRAFENLVAVLLSSIGFEDVVVLKYSGDGGLDIEAELTVGGVADVRTAVQVKRWKRKVPGKVVRELRGSLMTDQRGLVITTSSFTRDAVKEAGAEGKMPISLVDGEKLADLLIEQQIGVSKKSVPILEIDIERFEDLAEDTDVSPAGQALGLWPLPGGSRKLVASALKMLRYVAQTEPTQGQMVEWMRAAFPKAKSEKTIGGYIRVLKTLGLIRYDGETITVTPAGSDALTRDAADVILNQLRERVAGITQYLEALQHRTMTLPESHEFFKTVLSVEWETDYQTRMRLLWLANVGAIAKRGEDYALT